jgi:hypothetical protein
MPGSYTQLLVHGFDEHARFAGRLVGASERPVSSGFVHADTLADLGPNLREGARHGT